MVFSVWEEPSLVPRPPIKVFDCLLHTWILYRGLVKPFGVLLNTKQSKKLVR